VPAEPINSPFAHSVPGQPESSWEPLAVHLEATATLAGEFAAAFGAAEWGALAGRWHDLGKYRPEFQRRLRGDRAAVEHAGAGAVLAADLGLTPLAFAIAGHHSGLANPQRSGGGTTSLWDRLAANRSVWDSIRPLVPERIIPAVIPPMPGWAAATGDRSKPNPATLRAVEFWTRMIFSALVDADRLATEAFSAPKRSVGRTRAGSIADLETKLDQHLAQFTGQSPVDEVRHGVLSDCRSAAGLPPGFFTLTVPTGGGKTLSSMAFALKHARTHGQRRVIVAIPFTSIIEQNAAVLREALGADSVLEHHSSLDEAALREESSERETRRRLAVENWDAPVVVTTNVQLFESLFSNRPSRCRKLHNVARSVILLDEAQTLPPGFLRPVLDGLRELVSRYGCTVVLTTATQPALARRALLPEGLEDVREIVRDPLDLVDSLRRVRVSWPANVETSSSFEDVRNRMVAEQQVLAIVHRRQDARHLAELLPAEDRFHLSALMCPAHRLSVLGRVRAALQEQRPCRLVSTQLVEAGVDVDFPCVLRALAGVDSLLQSAGRCNREGKLRGPEGALELGRFEIFVAPTEPPPGILARGLETTRTMLAAHADGLDLHHPTIVHEYFRRLFSSVSLDIHGIQGMREGLNFADTGDAFRLIEDLTRPVVVPWGDASARLARHHAVPTRETLRALQPFVVNVYPQHLQALQAVAAAEEVTDGLFALTTPFEHLYHSEFGLTAPAGASADPASLII